MYIFGISVGKNVNMENECLGSSIVISVVILFGNYVVLFQLLLIL